MSEYPSGSWSMADVSAKAVTQRVAIAAGKIRLGPEAFGALANGRLPKGDALAMAEIAGILAAKQTPSLLPLCHPISLNRVVLRSVLRPGEHAVEFFCLAEIAAQTGVEMEALTGLSVALLTVWDLAKPINPALEITGQRLLFKSGGKRGNWTHPEGLPAEAEAMLAALD
ncbi:MAG: cyclic pyranopterin monophosphate synthase MoaC [Xanthomonadales bacterium]|nr:cyclic pyranopterin monophosphate synthase MoaC [Xanthomonadales bacterium]